LQVSSIIKHTKGRVSNYSRGRAPARPAKCHPPTPQPTQEIDAFRKMAEWAGRTGVRPLRKMERFIIVKHIRESMRETKKGYCQLHFAVLQQPLTLLNSITID